MKKVLILLCCYLSFNLYSQGCSDAGFCSLANTTTLSNTYQKREFKSTLRFGASYGKADNDINAYNSSLEFTRIVNTNMAFNAKINFLAHAGNSIQTGEIGDVYLTGDFNLMPDFRVTTGFKIPLHQGNKEKKGVVLPMDYQPTMGTFDFLFSIQRSFENWSVGTGIQIPLTQNDNKFRSTNFIAEENFITTNGFRRNPDVWFKLAYMVKMDKITFIPNLLPIAHLGDDTYMTDAGDRKAIMGSRGVTLNIGTQVDIQLCKKAILGFNAAMPIVTREFRPDGLGRKYVLTLDYRYSF